MSKQVLGKAVLVGRIGSIINMMERSGVAYHNAPKKNLDAYLTSIHSAQRELEKLGRELAESLPEETTLDQEYNKQTFDATIQIVRGKVLQRFGGFPMAAALLECFIMLLETELTLAAHFLNLRTKAGVEDRARNGNSYNLNGNPKN